MEHIKPIEGITVRLKNEMGMPVGRTFSKEVMRKYFGA